MKKIKNPLRRRIPKELLGDWRKYTVVSLFLILVIGFVSGMYVANESMLTSADEGVEKYRLEDGHFELTELADEELLSAVCSGEKADVKKYYINKAKSELDDRFEGEFNDEFEPEFKNEFDSSFRDEFDSAFSGEILNGLLSQGMDADAADAVLSTVIELARESGEYDSAYKTAYSEAYDEAHEKAYSEAYSTAYDSAWNGILAEIDEKYADAEEKYSLNDSDFHAVPVEVYENFFKNASEDNDCDGLDDGTVRVYMKNDSINMACLMDGRLPENDNEIAIDRMHADNVGVLVGDRVNVGGVEFEVVGLIAYVNYSTLHEKSTDFMFDALKFDVAMVTEAGFDRIDASIHYAYAWRYADKPFDEVQEKEMSDDFLPALLTQSVVYENELVDFLPRYANTAVTFATDDMGSDMVIGGVLLDVFIVIIAFIFAVTVSNTIVKESKTIGTLMASGYTKGELIRHYLAMPVIVTLISAAVGNLLGYTVFKNVVVSMYYNSYSLPTYETLWNSDAFVKTTVTPVILMLVVNLLIITRELHHTPLQFLRGDLRKSRRKKAVRLPSWSFFSRFRLRVILQNIPNYLVLLLGIFFVSAMLALAVGMPETLDYYKKSAGNMMFSRYQYVLKSCEDDDGRQITTENQAAEEFCMTSLQKKSEDFAEEISVYGISDESRYVKISGLSGLDENEVYISDSFGDKYNLSAGDTIVLDEKYENKRYSFRIAGIYKNSLSLSVFMPIDGFRTVFDLDNGEFSGFLSDSEISDIDEDFIATVITERDITKMCDQLDHSMGSYMTYFQVLCILLSAVMLYLLTKIIIEKNEISISMVKILGYKTGEIGMLYLVPTTIVLILADALCLILSSIAMNEVWKIMMLGYSGWFTFRIGVVGHAKIFLFVLIGYAIVAGLDFRRIKNISMAAALKGDE